MSSPIKIEESTFPGATLKAGVLKVKPGSKVTIGKRKITIVAKDNGGSVTLGCSSCANSGGGCVESIKDASGKITFVCAPDDCDGCRVVIVVNSGVSRVKMVTSAKALTIMR